MEAGREDGLAAERRAWRRGRRWLWWIAGGVLLALLAVELGLRRAEPFLRERIVTQLEERFRARVELDGFHVSLAGGLWAEGKGLRVWPAAQAAGSPAAAGEPLIRLDEFRFHAPLSYGPGRPIHISVVELKGLSVHLPPKTARTADGVAGGSPAAGKATHGVELVSFQVDTIECVGAELVLATSKPGKLPTELAIARFKLTNVAAGAAMGFDAKLTNPRPKGTIITTGSFGPWQTADPGESPITGQYRFEHADLSGFNGIAGILSSTGRYQGTLHNLTVDGQTDTPDFHLTHFGNALRLTTRFHARVDGTNGDTWLEPVEAMLGHSSFSVRGQVVRVPGAVVAGVQRGRGHDIALTVNAERARIEDFLRLASRGPTPLMTGALAMQAAVDIPPGAAPVHQRMILDGRFTLDQARFTNAKVQSRIAELSLRGQGRPQELKTADPAGILSHLAGAFRLDGGVLTLPALDYNVPGAKIQLAGSYTLEDEGLHFEGTARMAAPISKMVGGWKGLLLSPVDRYFEKHGAGTEVPIHIEGTREQPKFGIDFDRMKPHAQP